MGAASASLTWFLALILLCIAFGVDGQAPLAALLLSILGAALNVIPGAIIGLCWELGERKKNEG